MDKKHVHISIHTEDLALPEITVDTEEEAEIKEETKKSSSKKPKAHIRYDTLAIPEINIEE